VKVKQKLPFESNVKNIKRNYLETQTEANGTPGIINPLLLSNLCHPGILDYESKDESFFKKIIRNDFEINYNPEDPPKDFRLPVNRNDVISLSNWLDFMLETQIHDCSSANSSSDTKNEELQLIYSACFTEIIRQVSIECNERGVLLSRIWTSLVNIWETALNQKKEYGDLMQQNYSKEIKRINQMYESEIAVLKEKSQKLESEKVSLQDFNDVLSQNCRFLKNKNKKLEKDMRGVLEKFEELKKEFRQRELFQKKLELLLETHQIEFNKDQFLEEAFEEEGNNLKDLLIGFKKNETQKVKYEEVDVDNKYDLDHLVFGNKAVDTEGLFDTIDDYTEITKDLNFMLDKDTTTKHLIEFKDKQTQAKIKKEKKIVEMDEKELIEKTRIYQEKSHKNDSAFLEFIEGKYQETSHILSKQGVIENDFSKINDNLDILSMNDEFNQNQRKVSENLKTEQNDEKFEKTLSVQGIAQKPWRKNKKIQISTSKSPIKTKKKSVIFSPQIPLKKRNLRQSIEINNLKAPLALKTKISRHESISEKSENSKAESRQSTHSMKQKAIKFSPKKNSLSPIKSIIKSFDKKIINNKANAQIAVNRANRSFEPLIEFLQKKIFKRKVDDSLLYLEILRKFLNGNNLPSIFKENISKIYPAVIDSFNELEVGTHSLKKRIEILEIEKGSMKMELFNTKTQNENLIEENNKKNSKINYFQKNLESINGNMANMQLEYDKQAKNFHDAFFQEEGEHFLFYLFIYLFIYYEEIDPNAPNKEKKFKLYSLFF